MTVELRINKTDPDMIELVTTGKGASEPILWAVVSKEMLSELGHGGYTYEDIENFEHEIVAKNIDWRP